MDISFFFFNVNRPLFFGTCKQTQIHSLFFHILSLLSSRLNLHKSVSSLIVILCFFSIPEFYFLSFLCSSRVPNFIMKIVIDFFFFFFNSECSSITKVFHFSSESLIGSILSLFPLCCSLSKVILEILIFFF